MTILLAALLLCAVGYLLYEIVSGVFYGAVWSLVRLSRSERGGQLWGSCFGLLCLSLLCLLALGFVAVFVQ